MSGIHREILDTLQTALIAECSTPFDDDDPTFVGVNAVKLGPLQGEPPPDDARISITLHENDPDRFVRGQLTGMDMDCNDAVEELEVGGTITMRRFFTVKARCLLDRTQEGLDEARDIASILRSRIEKTIVNTSFSGVVADDGEFVSRPACSADLRGEMLQAGGPPDAYDFHIKVRFSVLTTRNGVTL
jgi:hypothetical protein